MVYTGIFATLAQVQYKAGSKASSVSSAEAYVNAYIAEAESYINVETGVNYSDTYAGLNADKKAILQEAASNLAACYVINYDLSGWDSKIQAQTMLDYLTDRADKCIKLLRDKNSSGFVSSP